MALKLYNFGWGPYPRRVTLYLSEKHGVDIERVEVEFPHQPDRWPAGFLRSLNPAHSLPVLETERGVRIRQSLAILEYLEERHPDPTLLGDTPEARAATRELVGVFDEATTFFGIWARQGSRLNASAHEARALHSERHETNLAAARVGAERFFSKLHVAEDTIADAPFLTGGRVTLADCVAYALLEFTRDFYGVELPTSCPKLAAWFAGHGQRKRHMACQYPPALAALARGLHEQSGVPLMQHSPARR
jgi:glutathione S-transferase